MTPDGFEVKYSLGLDFPASNNVTKYEALLAELRLAKECSAKRLAIYNDSELIVNQVNGNFEANNSHMAKYLARARDVIRNFDNLTLVHVPKTKNRKTDQLVRATVAKNPKQFSKNMMEVLNAPSIEGQEVI
ncbi:hypothetical protein Nepgr_019255 [Nepenthes gracilis]|uniref:RNase H type-1 domain-containing protein n=1 Tax=Nepenthes gracilis TaxID=150966 RepID=A0AAD3XUV0_NEPGR|nr:hypothetical protein Nepgr_019255 [Nepenthes gracilis]